MMPTFNLPAFQSEALLQQAIAALLARMPGVADIQILQGTTEFGKDIVFTGVAPLGESLNCAAVVKNTPLSGAVGSKGSVRALLDQINQSFDTPYFDSNGEPRRVHRVYVMCPHQIPQTTVLSIAGKIASQPGQVVFTTGAELFALFQKYWPDFLLHQASALQRFADGMAEATAGARALSTMAFDFGFDTVQDSYAPVYVRASFERTILEFKLDNFDSVLRVAEELGGTWTRATIDSLESGAAGMLASLAHLKEWPFPSTSSLMDIAPSEVAMRALKEEISEAFIESFKAKTGVSQARVGQVAHDVKLKVPLDRRSTITKSLSDAKQARDSFLKPIMKDIADSAAAIPMLPSTGVLMLRDPVFLRACKIDDCLQSASVRCGRVVSKRRFEFGKDILDEHSGDLLIVGGPGTGKTSFCFRSALADAERHAGDESKPVPIYVPLHRLSRVDLTSFERAFLGPNSFSTLLTNLGQRLPTGRIRCYLDGTDEVPDLTQRDRMLALALDTNTRPDKCQVVLTSRDYLYDKRLNDLPRIQLSSLGSNELRTLASGWLEDESASDAFMEQVGKSTALTGLVRVPLLATVTILIFKRTRRIPESRSRLYSTYVNLLCGGWDLAKGIVRPTRFGLDAKQVVLSCLADRLHENGLREFDSKLFHDIARGALGSHLGQSSGALLDEVLRDGVITRSGQDLHFCHLSIQEFLAAKYRLGDPNRKGLTASLRRFLNGEDWWREVLRFYIGLSDNPQAIQRWLDSNVNTDDVLRCNFLYDALSEAFPHFSVRRSIGEGNHS